RLFLYSFPTTTLFRSNCRHSFFLPSHSYLIPFPSMSISNDISGGFILSHKNPTINTTFIFVFLHVFLLHLMLRLLCHIGIVVFWLNLRKNIVLMMFPVF